MNLFGLSEIIPLAFFAAAAAIGFAIGYTIFGSYRRKFEELDAQYKMLKDSMDRLIDEYSDYKEFVDNSLEQKEREISQLSQLLKSKPVNNELQTELARMTLKCEQLELDNINLNRASHKERESSKIIEHLEFQLEDAYDKLKKKDTLLLNAKRESFPKEDNQKAKAYKKQIKKLESRLLNQSDSEENQEYKELKKQNKKLIKKLKKYKKKLKSDLSTKAEKVEYIETLDVKKLTELIESGKLLKRRKSFILTGDEQRKS